jgi:hypothetical protein
LFFGDIVGLRLRRHRYPFVMVEIRPGDIPMSFPILKISEWNCTAHARATDAKRKITGTLFADILSLLF